MRIVRVEENGGGNCLFRSCAYHIGVDHRKLRQQVANVIRDYPDLPINGSPLTEWLKWIGHNHIEYSRYISNNGILGTGIELMIISIIYRRCIRVMKRKNIYQFEMIAEYFPEFGDPFHLLFYGPANSGHYEVLEE